jgi:2-C-methyl-D-erythritol 4-phosphate cytidylyltransferase
MNNAFTMNTPKKLHQRKMSLQLNGNKELSNVSVILLAGGKGKRMKAAIPKQFLPLLGKPVFLRSLDCFQSIPSIIKNIIIVLDESFREEFQDVVDADSRIRWANPGVERQDSVFNGLNAIPDDDCLVAIHDAARPLVTQDEIINVLKDGLNYGAAVLGVPMKATVKESADGSFVLRTIPRSSLWEIHTPQVSTKQMFLKGFEKVNAEKLEVTDDVSVIEAMQLPVKLTLGEYTNIKLTTPDDMSVAEQILSDRGIQPYVKSKDVTIKSYGPGQLKPPYEKSTHGAACTAQEYMKMINKNNPI